MSSVSTGELGERIAAKYLEENGYEILKRNYKAANCEIDIIAKRAEHLAFVEVKARRDASFGLACEAVDAKKRQRIIKAAQMFIMSYEDYSGISFDVCEVYLKERRINYIENAFAQE